MAPNIEHRFICDDHLGKLARYLRVCGFDTVFDRTMGNGQLLQIALQDNRHILTRDTGLIEFTLVRNYILIESDDWAEQLKQVVDEYALTIDTAQFFSRCLEDNAPTVAVEKSSIRDLVYPYTYENHDDFRQCPLCRRVYWHGTHVKAMLDRLTAQGII
ncbi:MAG: Mut7-C RNAse domain-containing protein [Candidatus Zixiibacteriota bacterium]